MTFPPPEAQVGTEQIFHNPPVGGFLFQQNQHLESLDESKEKLNKLESGRIVCRGIKNVTQCLGLRDWGWNV